MSLLDTNMKPYHTDRLCAGVNIYHEMYIYLILGNIWFICAYVISMFKSCEEFAKVAPLNRAGKPSEVGKAIVFLASDAASYVTGTMLSVDGGSSKTAAWFLQETESLKNPGKKWMDTTEWKFSSVKVQLLHCHVLYWWNKHMCEAGRVDFFYKLQFMCEVCNKK